MEIKAAVARESRQAFTIESLELDEPLDDEVLVRMVAVGICHTDIVARDQSIPFPLPAVLGHEGAGIVERVGSRVTKVSPGDHVVLTFSSCGECERCQQGHPAYCRQFARRNYTGQRAGGRPLLTDNNGASICGCFFGQSSFASHAIASQRNVVKVPDDVPLDILGPLGCGIQTGAGAVFNVLRPAPGSSIVIFGAGAVGMAALLAAIAAGCTRTIVVDLNASRLNFARKLGATHIVNAAEEDCVDAVRAHTGGDGASFSLECTGVTSVVRQAVDATAIGGVCGIIGAAPAGAEVKLDINGLLLGRTIKGIIEGDSVPDVFIPRLIELWRLGCFPFDQMISFYSFEQINQAVEDAERGIVLKPVLRMSPAS